MKIARRTGGGRGVYEIAGQSPQGHSATDLVDRELYFNLTPLLVLKTGIVLKIQGGKPRLVRSGGDIQVQRQIAAILMMPKPIRATEAMGEGEPILRTENYVVEDISMDSVSTSDSDRFEVIPGQLSFQNRTGQNSLHILRRFSRVVSLWSERDKFPPQISRLLESHESAVMSGGPKLEGVEKIVSELQDKITLQSADLNIVFDESMDPLEALDILALRPLIPLCSKPLLILTGPSGTGKSRLAIEMATSFDYGPSLPGNYQMSRVAPATCMAFVPVGADWTDMRDLLGYRNPFGPKRVDGDSETNLTYEITDMLKLMLRAIHPANKDFPHFLILDEMNLSHVERYFSSFLSLMEADRSASGSGRLELINKEDLLLIWKVLQYQGSNPLEAEAAGFLVEEGKGLPYPPNLFVMGTVNVDETTYMFSPKVLDRAFVMELKSVDPTTYIEGAIPLEEKISGYLGLELIQRSISRRVNRSWDRTRPEDLFSQTARATGIDSALADQIMKGIKRTLSGAYKLLKPVGFDFGFRVDNEVFHFMSVWMEAQQLKTGGEPGFASDWQVALDSAVFMKVLPKIHGNRRRLGSSLRALAAFFAGEASPVASYRIGDAPSVGIENNEKLEFSLSLSRDKAEQLDWVLQASGYTTFIS